MRFVIAGSREIVGRTEFLTRLDEAFHELNMVAEDVNELGNGMCPRGVDALALQWAAVRGIPVTRFPADWEKYGRAAGPIRNRQMAEWADIVIVIRIQNSRGSLSMANEARRAGKRLVEIIVDKAT